jgi:hypothetical protein
MVGNVTATFVNISRTFGISVAILFADVYTYFIVKSPPSSGERTTTTTMILDRLLPLDFLLPLLEGSS